MLLETGESIDLATLFSGGEGTDSAHIVSGSPGYMSAFSLSGTVVRARGGDGVSGPVTVLVDFSRGNQTAPFTAVTILDGGTAAFDLHIRSFDEETATVGTGDLDGLFVSSSSDTWLTITTDSAGLVCEGGTCRGCSGRAHWLRLCRCRGGDHGQPTVQPLPRCGAM